jgi:hypothetical protein
MSLSRLTPSKGLPNQGMPNQGLPAAMVMTQIMS